MPPADRHRWAAIEVDFPDHPKILSVGALGAWAHIRAILYAAKHRTDGFIPTAAVWQILHDDPDMDEASTGLANSCLEASMVEANLWHPVANGYMIHDYLNHQLNAETIREKRARAGRLGGLAKAQKAASKTVATWQEVDLEVEQEQTPNPDPVVRGAADDDFPLPGDSLLRAIP